jgi:hypothetical protein
MPSTGGAFPGCGRAIVGSRAKGHRYPGMMVFVGSCVDLGSPGRAIPASGKARGRSASGTVRSAPAQQIQSGPNFAPARRAIVTWFVPAAAVQRPTMKFVATKTADQLDLQALHRVRERLVRQRTGIINQIRAFLLERGIAVRQGLRCLRSELPSILAKRSDALSPRMMHLIEDLAGDWRRLDERIEGLSTDITSLVEQDPACARLMTVPGIGPIISSASARPSFVLSSQRNRLTLKATSLAPIASRTT